MKLLIVTISFSLIAIAFGSYLLIGTPKTVEAETAANLLPETVKFRINASKSRFMVYADRTGVLYFKGRSHQIAVRDFDGEATLSLNALNPASLALNIRAASLEETSDVYTQKEKDIINGELKGIVLETEKYPAISFKSDEVKGEFRNGHFDIKIGGDITLHGVTRHIVIPATVTAEGETLHAKGEFSLDRKKFNVKATNAFHGTVRIKHKLNFTFDIVGERVQ